MLRDEMSLRCLAEMGVDVYLPRAAPNVAGAAGAVAQPLPISAQQQVVTPTKPPSAYEESSRPTEVLLLADIDAPAAKKLLADIARTLTFARIACAHAQVRDEAALSKAHGLVMFGDTQARAVGAVLPAQRQREIGWVVGATLSALARDAQAKRALWSELRRMTHVVADARQRTLAAAAIAVDHRGH